MKNCVEINEMISLYIDNLLNDTDKKEFENHMAECASCSEVLQETIDAIALVSEWEEAELPADFKEMLHKKLLKEKEKTENKKNFTVIINRTLKVAGTLAAVLVLTFIFRGMLGSFTGGKSTSDSTAAATTTAAAASVAAEAPAAPNAAKKTVNKDLALGTKAGSENGATAQNGVADYTVGGEAKEKTSQAKPEVSFSMRSMAAEAVTSGAGTLHYANMAIKVVDPTTEKVNILELLKNVGAEILPENETTDITVTLFNYYDKAESDSLVINFKISNQLFDALVSALKAKWGEAAVELEGKSEVDIGEKVKALEEQLAELKLEDQKKLKSTTTGAVSVSDEISKIQSELETLKKDLDFTAGRIVIKKT